MGGDGKWIVFDVVVCWCVLFLVMLLLGKEVLFSS